MPRDSKDDFEFMSNQVAEKKLVYILKVNDMFCGIFTAKLLVDIVYERTLKEVPPEAIVTLLGVKKNIRIVSIFNNTLVLRREKGKMLC